MGIASIIIFRTRIEKKCFQSDHNAFLSNEKNMHEHKKIIKIVKNSLTLLFFFLYKLCGIKNSQLTKTVNILHHVIHITD